MPFSTIDKPNLYFNTLTYSGNGSSPRTVTGVGFKPDFTWIKNRSRAGSSALNDNVRGAGLNKELSSESLNAEGNNGGSGYGYLSAFASDGFTLTQGSVAYDIVNRSGDSYVSWNWLASNTTASNTSGSITSTVSVNTTSGFSIVSWAGNATAGATVGHGLSQTPEFIIAKNRIDATNWLVWHKNLTGSTYYLHLELTDAQTTNSAFWSAFSSTTFTLGNSNHINGSGDGIIAYCFNSVKGFSKAFSYTGNGSTDGSYVHLGFRPAFVMSKGSSLASSWNIHDDKRQTFNDGSIPYFKANTNDAELSATNMDFLSNGFKLRTADNDWNGSGQTYIGIAFATNPFVSSKGIPTCAV